MINLYIARKVIKFESDSSQEIKYKKFLLINILLALKTLAKSGNFIIKLYDTFTPFTIGLIYIIFKNFETVSIFKPVSTRQYSPCRYLVAEKYLGESESENSIKYLESFLTKYIDFTNNNYDVKYFLPMAELRKNENFLKIIPEINNGITEKRIDALQEISNFLEKRNTKLYDKMAIKKFFLDNWGVPVINYDEKKLLKNQFNNRDKHSRNYNNNSKRNFTEDELAEAYKNVGKFDDDQLKMLNFIKKCNAKPKKKVKIENEVKPEEDLDEKYKRLAEKLNIKKVTKKVKNEAKNESEKKKSENNNEKEFLKKKTERDDKKSHIKKSKEQNINNINESKKFKEDNNNNDFIEDEEIFKIDEEIKKKLNKYKKIKK